MFCGFFGNSPNSVSIPIANNSVPVNAPPGAMVPAGTVSAAASVANITVDPREQFGQFTPSAYTGLVNAFQPIGFGTIEFNPDGVNIVPLANQPDDWKSKRGIPLSHQWLTMMQDATTTQNYCTVYCNKYGSLHLSKKEMFETLENIVQRTTFFSDATQAIAEFEHMEDTVSVIARGMAKGMAIAKSIIGTSNRSEPTPSVENMSTMIGVAAQFAYQFQAQQTEIERLHSKLESFVRMENELTDIMQTLSISNGANAAACPIQNATGGAMQLPSPSNAAAGAPQLTLPGAAAFSLAQTLSAAASGPRPNSAGSKRGAPALDPFFSTAGQTGHFQSQTSTSRRKTGPLPPLQNPPMPSSSTNGAAGAAAGST